MAFHVCEQCVRLLEKSSIIVSVYFIVIAAQKTSFDVKKITINACGELWLIY
jgi:hypothetical protein